ncbi:MAG: oligopeptide transporter, OPT family [Candidatus Marinimicrobia bacterium]|jgi:putative OPT family oligopeptide transporter|nr:oligopeptide transporter, OPT family [Candidatus Neomarinimicrobiota bacterium]MBT3728380.1 oligopeptide transporter, OPT family [Candidatus Neomarinimicrobiota bacterium]MBT3944020.1 oligopeptide transporter, OPT family [Candidatus Neomarinimicrobiota bacterium]MBT4706942.1 oligopeptide transporter, OPT family [Candidatus Neomarinimicrobiota bacterium]MBT4926548.1 oligopeptide transporter, OPT family [Candidatus Neomarinimicrobiota bacterium]
MKQEITVKAFFLSILLSIVLSSAMAYLGLYAGMTISASIPAAIMSMGILKLFRESNILENNIVQTAASAGESLAAGVIFTIPALLLIGYWDTIDYWEVTKIAMVGGILGALFTVPLRRALILKANLKFPEGVATAAVLKTGHESDAKKSSESLKIIGLSAVVGGVVKLGELAFGIWSSAIGGAVAIRGAVFGLGSSLSPSLISVGYIVGRNIGILAFSGGLISWVVAIPIYSYLYGYEGDSLFEGANIIWNAKIRYLGVGAMVVGGIWSVIQLAKPLVESIQLSLKTLGDNAKDVPLEERDLPINYVFIAILLMLIPISYTYFDIIPSWTSAITLSIIMCIFGFLFSAVAAYMAGVVGSSNNPISGVTIATILFSSLLIITFFDVDSSKGGAAAILIGAVVCCAAAIGGDNLQDLKTGNIVGATPWKQQLMQLVGVISSALTLGIVLTLLHEAYGIGSSDLPAPQAVLMTSVANGVFSGNLEWGMIYAGGILGILIIMLDQYQLRRGAEFRVPILAVAIGIYLPIELTLPIFIGGMLNHFAGKTASDSGKNNGLLLASGLITGEALMAIFIAIPLFYDKNFWPEYALPSPYNDLIGFALIATIIYGLYKVAKK